MNDTTADAPNSPDSPDPDDFIVRPAADDADRLEAVIKRHARMLREHFDTVQIVATRHIDDDTGTSCHWGGLGNLYARVGSVRLFIDNSEADDNGREDS